MNPRKNWLAQRRSKPETPPQEADKAAPQAPGNALRGGSYSVALTAVVLAILIAANFFVSALPSSMTTYDISASKLYSVTSNTKAVASALEEDVNIYWIVQSGEEDDVLENLLSRYAALSDHITVETRNPDEYPTFAAQYTDETVENNSLVVTCGERSRYIAFDEIYVEETSAYSYSYSTSFDGEGAITSAIDYVTSDDLPKLYLLEGHGEAELPATFAEQIEKENIETESLSLLNVDEIPEDADALLIYAPASDISEEEADLLAAYVEAGGKLLAVAGPTEDGLPENLYSLLSIYGVSAQEGIVIEGNRGYYAFQSPYVLSLIHISPGEGGLLRVRIQTGAQDVYAASRRLFFAFAQEQKALCELVVKRASLEDVFLELTESAGEPPAEEPGPQSAQPEEKEEAKNP